MQVRDIMTADVTCCTPADSLRDVAAQMIACDCGAIPIVDPQSGRAVGIVTDRDIVCRAVAQGQNPTKTKAGDVMTRPIAAVRPDASVEDCLAEMERAHVRRMLVVDDGGTLCGVVAQADIALKAPEHETAELVKDLSKPTGSASEVH